MKALILAGSRGEQAIDGENSNKALIKIGKQEMIFYVISTLKKIKDIDKIAVIGDKKVNRLLQNHVDYLIEEDDSLFENILKGIRCFDDDENILILTSDIPMISQKSVEDFIRKAKREEAEFCYPIVSKEDSERKFPGTKRTYVKIKDGTFTGGNIIMAKVSVIRQILPEIKQVLAYRKKPLKLAKILGPLIVIKFLLGILTIRDVEQRVSNIFKVKARAIKSKYAEIATDVDKGSDLKLAREILSQEGL